MATILRDNIKNKLYVLIGAGFGESKTSRPNPLMSIASTTTSSESELLAVSDASGEIVFLPSFQLSVVSVDGQSCRDLILAARKEINAAAESTEL